MNKRERIFYILKTIRCMLGWHDYKIITIYTPYGISGWNYSCRICGYKKYVAKDIE